MYCRPLPTTAVNVNTDALAHHAATDCPNCDAAVSGNFCHACGQETVLHPPSTREFVHEFIGHYVALEGKLWKSLGLLLFRPGRLSLEYINGRRVRYIQPLRLYLTLSVIFFAVLKYDGHDFIRIGSGKTDPVTVTAKDGKPAAQRDDDDDDGDARPSAKAPAAAAAAAASAKKPDGPVELIHQDQPDELRDVTRGLRAKAGAVSPHAADKLGAFFDLPAEDEGRLLTAAFFSYAPYAIFFMMPLFALYLKVLYLGSGRRYGEHLLFALHANGFAFLAFTLIWLVPKWPYVHLLKYVLWAWLAFYLPTAMRHVYGGSRFFTGLRWVVLMFLHLLTMALALVGALAFGIVH
jgi:hypothetical protein